MGQNLSRENKSNRSLTSFELRLSSRLQPIQTCAGISFLRIRLVIVANNSPNFRASCSLRPRLMEPNECTANAFRDTSVEENQDASTGCFLHRFIGNLITSYSGHAQGGGITRRRNYYLVPNNAG